MRRQMMTTMYNNDNNSFWLPRHSLKLVGVRFTTAISYDISSIARTNKSLEQVEQGLENPARPPGVVGLVLLKF